MKRVTNMTEGSIPRLVMAFALPLILTNIGQQLYMIVDASIVGRGVGVQALASVGSTDWCYWLILWSVTNLTQAFATFVARAFGKGDYRQMNKVIAMSVLLCASIGAILTVAGILTARPLLTLLRTPSDIIDGATVYLITMIAGTLVVTAYNMAAAILRAFGNGRSPLVAMIIAALLNIGLDLLFVLAFHWGIFGAAIASVSAQAVSFFYCLTQIRKIDHVKLDRAAWTPDFKLMGELLRFGVPIALQYVVIAVSGIVLQSTVNAQGSTFVAGFTATNKLYGLLESTAISVGLAFATFFSQNYGAGNARRFREGVKVGFGMCVGMALMVMAVVIPLSGTLLQLFLDVRKAGGMEALSIAKHYLHIMTVCLLILYPIHIYRNALQAMGNSVWPMLSGFSESAARILMAKVVVLWLGIEALYFAEPVAWLGALMVTVLPYYHYQEKLLKE